MCLKNVIHPIDFTRVSSTRRDLPNCAPSHSQPLSPTPSHSQPPPATLSHSHQLQPIFQEKQSTPTHFSRKTSHSHPFFNKSDTLLFIFQLKRPTPTQFSGTTTHSHPFFDKNIPIPAISDGTRPTLTQVQPKQPTPTYFSTNSTHSGPLPLIFHEKRPTPTILTLFSTGPPPKELVHHFSNYNRIFLPVTINVLKELSLENIIFEYSTSEKKRKAYFSKNQIYPSILLCMNMEGSVSHINKKYTYLKMR